MTNVGTRDGNEMRLKPVSTVPLNGVCGPGGELEGGAGEW